ncbi:hypothetical protein CKA32_003846 [Geitlerinema sp. FC II]|uniref:AbrB/MazE/SpoVT family DNA-binding domain-containing protein n=1 Tax=Baaleninema simplex TaxID=2862350 RepID=UPI00034DF94B|nr:AbrB/MazE/SpoVT family DNA-binding domain-containing protein [Baaleninema simplex]PPT07236.1 hypothetical protein CKA32_003846 [Geitlerinema sp. FC II]
MTQTTIHITPDGQILIPQSLRDRLNLSGDYTLSVRDREIILKPIEPSQQPNCDFSDLIGRLSWEGDALETQQQLRDEWN